MPVLFSPKALAMHVSMEDYMKIVIPYLHAELIDSQALSKIQALAQVLPPSPIAFFECRLEDNQPQVDFQVGLPNAISHTLIKSFFIKENWYNCKDFILEWVDPKSSLNQHISYIFLEFDLPEKTLQVPIPCFFLSLNQKVCIELKSLIELAYRKLNYSITRSLKSSVSYCFDCLPAGSIVTHFGLMLPRSNMPLKLVIQGTNLQQLLSYLVKLGCINVSVAFSSIALELENFVDSFRLSFDIYDGILPKVGLECFLLKQSADKLRWYKLINYLVDIGICMPVKRDALLAWLGFSQKADAPENWPSNLTGGDLFLGSNALSIFWREISHIKIIYDPVEDCLSAKGYLSFGHSWLDVDLLARSSEIIEA